MNPRSTITYTLVSYIPHINMQIRTRYSIRPIILRCIKVKAIDWSVYPIDLCHLNPSLEKCLRHLHCSFYVL